MQSPFYFIQPNDIILVKPLKRKAIGAGETATQHTYNYCFNIFSLRVNLFFNKEPFKVIRMEEEFDISGITVATAFI